MDIAPIRVSSAEIPAWVALVESAYRGEDSRAGWTTEADLLGGQRIDEAMAAEVLADPNTVVFMVAGADPAGANSSDTDLGAVATVQLVRGDGYAYLGMFAVAPTAQGTGVGSQLMAWAESWVSEQWASTRVRMTVIKQREELIAFYVRRGYEPTGETEPFPYGDERFGQPKRDDLEFVVLEKRLRAL